MNNKFKQILIFCSIAMLVSWSQGSTSNFDSLENIDPNTISKSEYVIVKDGHLSVNGQRKRYWAAVGKVYANADIKSGDSPERIRQKVELAHRSTDIILDRLQEMGFNSVRFWDGFIDVTYQKDDGSTAD